MGGADLSVVAAREHASVAEEQAAIRVALERAVLDERIAGRVKQGRPQ